MIDLAGQRFGKLLVEGREGSVRGQARWRCRCDCGRTSFVGGYVLRSGDTKSCGCQIPVVVGAMFRTHGLSARSEYRSWQHMVRRCTNPGDDNYRNYGGRGIKVCDRWLHSFPDFLTDMGPRPPGTTLVRVDVNGNYEPDNCRWATTKMQARNTRHTRLTESLAGRIRSMRASGRGVRSIGRELGIGHDQVSRICNGRTWARDEIVLDPGQGVGKMTQRKHIFRPMRTLKRAALIEAAAAAIREGRSLWIVGPSDSVQTATEFLHSTCFPMLMLGNPNRVSSTRRDCRP